MSETATPNSPDLWLAEFPRPRSDGHKYDRGHAVVLGSTAYTGASRLAAEACSRIGSGLVTVHSEDRVKVYQSTLPADIMVTSEPLTSINRATTLITGPGTCNAAQAEIVLASDPGIGLVLDADAIRLAERVDHKDCVLTPHRGEYERFFGALGEAPSHHLSETATRLQRVIILKGAETLIASPEGHLVHNANASPYLAKAGTGDVLAGYVGGLLAQGMRPFEAACAAVWIHGAASTRIGPGLIPQELNDELPALLRDLLA